MRKKNLEKSLSGLAEATKEMVDPGLAEDIKRHIPDRLAAHRGRDTVNIIIDLRINKLAAAAVIIIAMVLFANFYNGRDSASDSIYEDSKLLIKYYLGGETVDRDSVLASLSRFYESLVNDGREVVYYRDITTPGDKGAILMYWKVQDGSYKVVFGDLRRKTVSAEELIRLQGRMLKKMME